MSKSAAFDVLVDGVECASGDGPAVKFPKGKVSPKNEYEETLLNAAVEAGLAKPPADIPAIPEED